jgi:hypothetical protein
MSKQHADPAKTKTGKIRLGPLNARQLTDMMAKESRPKIRAKIQHRLARLAACKDAPDSVCTSEHAEARTDS